MTYTSTHGRRDRCEVINSSSDFDINKCVHTYTLFSITLCLPWRFIKSSKTFIDFIFTSSKEVLILLQGMIEKKVSTTLLADYLFFIKHALMLKSSMVDQIHFSVKDGCVKKAIINIKKEAYRRSQRIDPIRSTIKIPPST